MRTIVVAVVVIAAGMISGAGAQTKQTCVTAKCHASMGTGKFVHGPVAVGDCLPCHELVPGETHRFKTMPTAETLCLKCHDPIAKKAVVHAPVTQGRCTACHEPHQAKQQFFLRSGSVSTMCFLCHKPDAFTKKNVHAPVAEGDCIACHAPHTSDKVKLLVQGEKELCFQCHADLQETLAQAKHIHSPVGDGCVGCHNAHANDAPFLLAGEQPALCFDCHNDMREHVAAATVKHAAVETGGKCTSCHTPHDAPYDAQLKDEPMALCLSCHNRETDPPRAGSPGNMALLFESNKQWHGPIRDRDCSGCHDTHGSTEFRILRQRYPREFYTAYSPDQYALCFSCHEPTLARDPRTATLTGFRDGDTNLHYLHVNKKVKGRTCRSCHETHASQKARHIRESVPFGQWMLPIRFELQTNGGKCSPGCHAPASYARSTGATSGK